MINSIYKQNIDLFEDLNDDQKEAVKYFETPLRIIAGAGSGKTKVLTRKISHLINEGVSPREILAVTFTNKACNEMNIRVHQYCGNLTSSVNIFTFHALCVNILRQEAKTIGYRNDFIILDEADKKQILSTIYKEKGIPTHQISISSMIQYISWGKNKYMSVEELAKRLKVSPNDAIPQVYKTYIEYTKNKGSMDFDDLIIKVEELFQKLPSVAKRWSEKFSFILVDEFQDTSTSQYNIIKSLCNENTHLTIVGDPDQTIYNWRGANVNLILDFDKEFIDVKTIVLDINYRSTKTILDAANRLIRHNKNRFSKDLVTHFDKGDEIEFFHGFSMEAEARWVVQKINELRKQKIQLKNIVILYRANYYSRSLEDALLNEGINYKIFDGVKFFQRREIKDALAFLRVIYDGSDIALERIINVPSRGIGDATLKKLKDYSEIKGLSLHETLLTHFKTLPVSKLLIKDKIFPFLKIIIRYRIAIKDNKISVVLSKLLEEIGYFKEISNDDQLTGSAIENVRELINSIESWQKANSNKGIKDYLDMVALFSSKDEYDSVPNYVSLMTVHSSKGLEFENVFVVGLSERIFPSWKALDGNSFLGSLDGLEEERRLAYVAITRAKKRLFISDSRGYIIGTNIEKEPSRFIRELGINLSDFILAKNSPSEAKGYETEESITLNEKILQGDIISHTLFGEGTVLEVNGHEITANFIKDRKIRTLRKSHPSIRLISK